MKELEKEIITKSTKTVFVAYDNKEFCDKEECQKYEGTAKAVITRKLIEQINPLPINQLQEYVYTSDWTYDYYLKVDTQEKLDILKMFCEIHHFGVYLKEDDYILKNDNEFIFMCDNNFDDGYLYSLKRVKENLNDFMSKIGSDSFLKETIKHKLENNYSLDKFEMNLVSHSTFEKLKKEVEAELKEKTNGTEY